MIVQCSTCVHFTPSETTPSHGMGSCAIKAWPKSQPVSSLHGSKHPPAPWPLIDRYCDAWRKG